MSEINRPCEYPDCEGVGYRHLARHYFCNEHRRKLVKKAKSQSKPIAHFQEWVEECINE